MAADAELEKLRSELAHGEALGKLQRELEPIESELERLSDPTLGPAGSVLAYRQYYERERKKVLIRIDLLNLPRKIAELKREHEVAASPGARKRYRERHSALSFGRALGRSKETSLPADPEEAARAALFAAERHKAAKERELQELCSHDPEWADLISKTPRPVRLTSRAPEPIPRMRGYSLGFLSATRQKPPAEPQLTPTAEQTLSPSPSSKLPLNPQADAWDQMDHTLAEKKVRPDAEESKYRANAVPTAPADDWRSLRNEFEALSKEVVLASADGPRGCLSATVIFEGDSAIGEWSVSGPTEDLRERFKALASRAGAALGPPEGTKAWSFWLRCLYLDQLEHKSKPLRFARKDRENGVIELVCAASATYCSRLEQEAIEKGALENSATGPTLPNSAVPLTRPRLNRKKSNLRARRLAVIFAAIQADLKGPKYCRFLDENGIRPLHDWISERCPGTFAAAYKAGEPWRKKIQDEKHRFQLKYDQASIAERECLIQAGTRPTRS